MLNPGPYNTAVDRAGGQLSTPWFQWFVALYNFVVNGVVDYTQASVQVPTAGFAITIATKGQVLTLDPAGVLATGTVTLPANAYDGQPVQVSSTKTITALTVNASGSDTIKNAPTTLTGGSGFAYYYHALTTTWYRLY